MTQKNAHHVSDPRVGDRLGWIPFLLLCAVGLTVTLTWLGPSAADHLTGFEAMVFWAAHVFPALVLLAGTQLLLASLTPLSGLPGYLQVGASAIAAAVLFTPLALLIDGVFQSPGSQDDAVAPLHLRALSEFGHFAVPFVLIWILINTPSLLQIEPASPPAGPPQADAEEPDQASLERAAFWSRVPLRLGRDLVALSAELHYLRVYTRLGDTLILFPFGRAIDLMEDSRGLQIHRSHWIALDHLDEVITRDGRLFCRMQNGLSLPVSRSCKAALKGATGGLIQSVARA